MSKEIWLQSYECAIEDIANQFDIDIDTAQTVLDLVLRSNPNYLDGWYS